MDEAMVFKKRRRLDLPAGVAPISASSTAIVSSSSTEAPNATLPPQSSPSATGPCSPLATLTSQLPQSEVLPPQDPASSTSFLSDAQVNETANSMSRKRKLDDIGETAAAYGKRRRSDSGSYPLSASASASSSQTDDPAAYSQAAYSTTPSSEQRLMKALPRTRSVQILERRLLERWANEQDNGTIQLVQPPAEWVLQQFRALHAHRVQMEEHRVASTSVSKSSTDTVSPTTAPPSLSLAASIPQALVSSSSDTGELSTNAAISVHSTSHHGNEEDIQAPSSPRRHRRRPQARRKNAELHYLIFDAPSDEEENDNDGMAASAIEDEGSEEERVENEQGEEESEQGEEENQQGEENKQGEENQQQQQENEVNDEETGEVAMISDQPGLPLSPIGLTSLRSLDETSQATVPSDDVAIDLSLPSPLSITRFESQMRL